MIAYVLLAVTISQTEIDPYENNQKMREVLGIPFNVSWDGFGKLVAADFYRKAPGREILTTFWMDEKGRIEKIRIRVTKIKNLRANVSGGSGFLVRPDRVGKQSIPRSPGTRE